MRTLLVLVFLLLLFPTINAKAGGVPSANITNITLDASQSPPTCGRASPCHDETLNDFGAEVNISATTSTTGTTNVQQDIAVIVSVNESVDEIGCILMNHTNPDLTAFWAEGIGVSVVRINETGEAVNWYQSTGSLLSFNYTILPRTVGFKQLIIACGGGLTVGGQQDWALNTTFNITVSDPIFITSLARFKVSFDMNPAAACPIDGCWITVDTFDNFSHINFSVDEYDTVQVCANCTIEQFELIGLPLGTHIINISTLHGEECINVTLVDSSYYDSPPTILNIVQDIKLSMSAIALAILALGFFLLSTRFEKDMEIPIRAGLIITGILLAVNVTLIIIEDSVASASGAFHLLIWIVRLATLVLFMIVLLKSIKAIATIPKAQREQY